MSFGSGQNLEILHRIDDDWWFARCPEEGQCGMVPANYFIKEEIEGNEEEYEEESGYVESNSHFEALAEDSEIIEEAESFEAADNFNSSTTETEAYDEDDNEEGPAQFNAAAAPPPPPLPKNPVQNIEESSFLKLKCDALFLDSKFAKCKGQLMMEKALYLCSESSIEHCYDHSELRDYDAVELKLTLNSGEKVAIGLGKKDAKKFSEMVKDISGYEDEKEVEAPAPPLPKAPIVVGPKMPEAAREPQVKAAESKIPMIVGVSFEGVEREEVSIFEGEEVYLIEPPNENQFSRIEKINGVQGFVPSNFLLTRSDYQKKVEAEKSKIAATEEKLSNLSVSAPQITRKPSTSMKSKPAEPVGQIGLVNSSSSSSALTRRNSNSSSPWSALASGSPIKEPKSSANTISSSNNHVKLENSRLWKDKSGKFQVEAEFVSFSDGKVTILKTSGSQVTVPLEILSERDVEYVCKRAGIPLPTKSTKGSVVKGFDWSAFFLSLGIEVGVAREFGEKFASQSFEESMISSFTSDFLSAQGMNLTEIYKILPEAAKRKAQAMQTNAKEKHRSNHSQMVLRSEDTVGSGNESRLSPYAPQAPSKTHSQALSQSRREEPQALQIEKFPTIEELEAQGAIEVGNSSRSDGQLTLPSGISVSKQSSSGDNTRVLVQPVDSSDVKERTREVVGSDGSMAKEYTRISSSTSVAPFDSTGSTAIALLQQQMQSNAMMQAQAQAQAQAQVQMQMRIQAQAQAQAQMQMRAQAAAQAQAQAQAQYAAQQQQQRLYQMQQQQSAPSVHITIHTGDKASSVPNPSTMTPPLALMNQPMMQMNNPMAMGGGMMGGMSSMSAMSAMNPMNPMNPMNSMTNNFNPFDPNVNPFFPNGNGYPF